VRTEQTYKRANPKRVYYISMEFLIGRSLANNVTNLLLDPLTKEVVEKKSLDLLGLLEQEPDAGLGNGGLGRLAACFLDSMATMELPAMGYGLRYEYGIFRQSLENGWQLERPDNWLRYPDPWEVVRLSEQVEVKLNCAFELRGGGLRPVLGRPSTLIGIPFDRPVVGFGGKTINTLRLWAAAAPDFFNFQQFSGGEFVGALAETLAADSLNRYARRLGSNPLGNPGGRASRERRAPPLDRRRRNHRLRMEAPRSAIHQQTSAAFGWSLIILRPTGLRLVVHTLIAALVDPYRSQADARRQARVGTLRAGAQSFPPQLNVRSAGISL
jgi:hypothetical protein